MTTVRSPGTDDRIATRGAGWFQDSDAPEFGKALTGAVTRSVRHPRELAGAGITYAGSLTRLGPAAISRLWGSQAHAPTDQLPDKRFSDPAWTNNPAFFVLRGAYDAACRLGDDVLDAGSKDPIVDAKARLAWRMVADALAPTNFLLTNPAALRRAAQTGGRSVVAGASNFMSDLATNRGRPRQVDNRGFELGDNLAATAGTVVFRNDLMELIQYAPQTPLVHEVPLLAVPPWINKYYVMDLAPGRSFLEWAVQHERTVFVISYLNAGESLRNVTMDDYLRRGPLAAIEVIADITGAPVVDLAGLCIGGAMVAMTAAYLAQQDRAQQDRAQEDSVRVGSITLLNTLLDYSDPGALGVFTDERSVARLELQMARSGFLEADQMAGTFDALRPNDLIFAYVVSGWLLGEDPPAFDILSWNADSTRMPGAMHAFYLRALYIENRLAHGDLELAGRRLSLGDVTAPAYVVGAVNDHIVPWTASYRATQLLGGDVRYVLSNGGHIAGVVNPPAPKAWHLTAATHPADPQEWRAGTTRCDATWWEDWAAWGSERAGDLVAPPGTGSGAHPPLGDAPGDYIRS